MRSFLMLEAAVSFLFIQGVIHCGANDSVASTISKSIQSGLETVASDLHSFREVISGEKPEAVEQRDSNYSGLRRKVYRIGQSAKHKQETEKNELEDASSVHKEDVFYWSRVLQQSGSAPPFLRNGESMSYGAPPQGLSMSYPNNQFYNKTYENQFSSWYNLRYNVKQGAAYNCTCQNRYGEWENYRNNPSRRLQKVKHDLTRKREAALANEKTVERKLDFYVAGFPKCGTTTLLYAFNKHSETAFSKKEHCALEQSKLSDAAAYMRLNATLDALNDDPTKKVGLKCPILLKTFMGLDRLFRHSPGTKLVLGVRHPIEFFESFYNYRVTELHNQGRLDSVPRVETLTGENEWMGVSTDQAQFEVFLMQLGKTGMSNADLDLMRRHSGTAMKPFPFKVFLYDLGQLKDSNQERSNAFRSSMQRFLELEKPIEPFGRENHNDFVGNRAHPETIDICQERYSTIRSVLLNQAEKTRSWIRDQFLESPDVVIGNKHHFFELLENWTVDPCEQKKLQNGNLA